jgi:hypothetical protein
MTQNISSKDPQRILEYFTKGRDPFSHVDPNGFAVFPSLWSPKMSLSLSVAGASALLPKPTIGTFCHPKLSPSQWALM